MKKAPALALALLSLALAGPSFATLKVSASSAAAPAVLTSADKAYLIAIQQDPQADFLATLTPQQIAQLHSLINSKADPQTKKDQVDRFLDDVVAQQIWDMGAKKT